MVTRQHFEQTLTMVLDHILPVATNIEYRLVGTGAALMQGVSLPVGDIDILVKERAGVDTFGAALSAFPCLQAPVWMPQAGQYYAEFEVNGVEVGFSTVEADTDLDGMECVGRGPWEHFEYVTCGAYKVPAVALELRLVSELMRNRPDRYEPLIQHMRKHGCDIALVRLGMEMRHIPQAWQNNILAQL